MKKKVKFASLKPGTKFRFRRALYMVDELICGVRLSDGKLIPAGNPDVTPVKVKIIAV